MILDMSVIFFVLILVNMVFLIIIYKMSVDTIKSNFVPMIGETDEDTNHLELVNKYLKSQTGVELGETRTVNYPTPEKNDEYTNDFETGTSDKNII